MSRVLLIDSDPSSVFLLTEPLKEYKLSLEAADTGRAGIAAAHEHPPTLILLALDLSDGDGLDVLHTFRGRARTAHIPVIILSSRSQAARQITALEAGADDFISKPFDMDNLGLRVRNAAQRAMRDGLTHPLTGLPTGKLAVERIRALADEDDWYKIDLEIEHFTPFKEAYGFMTGQEVITFTGGVLSDCVRDAGRPDDFIGQRSDTEFVVITDLAHGPDLKALIQQRFDDGARSFYGFMERDQGMLTIMGENGESVQHPLMQGKIKTQQGEEA